MYSFRFDDTIGVMVGAYRGSFDTEDDWARCLASLDAADKGAFARGVPLVCIVAVSSESPQLPAIWRKRMADWQSSVRSPALYFALVAPNALIRGVFTAINWMTRFRSNNHLTSAAPTFADAAKWVRKVTGSAYPSLETLYEEALSAPASGARIVAGTRSAS